MKYDYPGNELKEGIVVDKDQNFYLVIEDTNQFYIFKSVDTLELLNSIFWSETGEIFTANPIKRINAQIQTGDIQVEKWLEKASIQ